MDDYEELAPVEYVEDPLPLEILEKFARASQLDFEIEFFGRILEGAPNLVDVLRVMGNNLTAKGDYQRGLEMDRRLTLLCPHDRIALYNLACSYSLVGMVDPGLKALQQALEAGYDEFEYLQEDRDLEALRRDPRFRELLAAYDIV